MSPARRAALVFPCVLLCAFCYLLWLAGSRFFLALNDEGIYLDGGFRVLHGQIPYRDFFSLTGPGTFWLEAFSMRWFGATMLAGRIPAVLDIAILAACIFWLVAMLDISKRGGQLAAVLASITYLAFTTAGETAVAANHRWDSSAWAVLAATLLVAAIEYPSVTRSRGMAGAAGIAVGFAAWCTPPVALAAMSLGACLLAYRSTRSLFLPYAGGVGLTLALGALWIVSAGAMPAMLNSLLWTASNYSGPNRAWYGSVTGGYANLLQGMPPGQTATTVVLLAFLTLPATLPFFSAIWLWKRPSKSIVLLMALGASLIFSAYPRWDLNHLTWVSAPFFALTAALLAQHRYRKAVAVVVLIAAGSCLMASIEQRLREPERVTSVGKVHGRPGDLDILAGIQARVKPSDTLFVFPYRPLLYFVTGAKNPTRYSFLQPGMFSDQDESDALNDLRASPPRWVFYTHVAPAAYLRNWPGSDRRRLQMPGIEQFLRENYQEAGRWADFQLLEAGSLHAAR